MKWFRQAVAYLMILSLALVLVACKGKSGSDGDDPQAGGETIEQTQGEPKEVESQESKPSAVSADLRIGSVKGLATDDVALVAGEWGCKEYDSVDALASAFIAGDVDFAVVPPDVSSALYNATGGALMAIDGTMPEEGEVRSVTVVTLSYFRNDPETMVGYIARHRELVDSQMGDEAFLSGSRMQRELSDDISDYYVFDPSSVGSALPPDNFYFLG